MIGATETRRAIWIVDDSRMDAERAERVLATDYAVTTFSEGSSALELVAQGALPDALVLDWMMPGLSGLDVCQFIRSRGGPSQKVGILMVTVARETDQVVAGLRAGANDFLIKPFAEDELRERIAAILRTRKALEESEQAEARLRALLHSAPDALMAFDERGFVTFASDEAALIFGVSPEELIGRAASELLPTLARLPTGQAPAGVHLPDVRIGERIYAPTVRTLQTAANRLRIVALRDVTAGRNEEIRRMDFYSIVAHDMRSPLAAMMLRNTLLERGRYGVLPPSVLGELRKNDATMKALLRLINDFLDFARLEGAGLKLDREETDLVSLVGMTLDDLRPLADARQLQLTFEPSRGPVVVRGDRHRLLQVVTNLLSNAIKFTPAGGTVDVILRSGETYLEVGVRDTGPGIPAAALPTLFDRFTRVESSGQASTGTGLGLMIAKQIVEAHGGHIWVESQEGKGSEFWFRLPRPNG
jgi:signal transduction histidine kinase/DNA-binding response OmpR family regulator